MDPALADTLRGLGVPDARPPVECSNLPPDGPPLLCPGEDLPDPLPEGWVTHALGPGERREVLLGGDGGLVDLPEGTPVQVASPRHRALLRAHHPGLEAVGPGEGARHRLRPLWEDPSLEAQGEVLEWASWLPEPGQGIPVLLAPAASSSLPSPHPGATAALEGERALSRAFPGRVVCVRGLPFGPGIRFQALLLSPDGRRVVRGEEQGRLDQVPGIIARLVALLEARGADLLLPVARG